MLNVTVLVCNMATSKNFVFDCVTVSNPIFDSKRDLRPVEDILPLSISSMLESGVVPPDGSEVEYAPDYSDPSCIRGRVVDTFEAIRKVNGLVSDAHHLAVQSALNDSSVPTSE